MRKLAIRQRQKKTVKVSIADPGKSLEDAHSEGLDTERGAEIQFWQFTITPNAPMTVFLTRDGKTTSNAELLKKRLTLEDVPDDLHDDVAHAIAEDIIVCLDSAGEELEAYRINRRL